MIRLPINLSSQIASRSSVISTPYIPLPFQLTGGKYTLLLPKAAKSLKIHNGSKISYFFRIIFEHKSIKKIFGTNLALILFAASIFPTNQAKIGVSEKNNITEIPFVLSTEKSVQYPLNLIIISRGFYFYHPGIDFDATTGDPIQPIKTGKVKEVSHSRLGYGNSVIIDHGNKITSLYAHLSKIDVEKNQEVTMDTIIGKVGSTGISTGDHLHLEVRESNIPINPAFVLPTQ